MRIILFFICFLSLQCSDYINSAKIEYDSIFLDGGSWIQIDNRGQLFIDENSLDILEEGAFTIEFWLSNKIINSTDSPALFMIGNDSNEIELGVFQNINKPNALRIYYNNSNFYEIEVDGLNWADEEKFYYIAFAFDNLELEVYIDGLYIDKVPINNNLELSGNDIFVGSKGFKNYSSEPTNFWSGNFDEIRIWKKPLSNIFYFSSLYTDIDTSLVSTDVWGEKTLIDPNNDNITECLIIDNWDNTNTHYQEIDDLTNTEFITEKGYNNCVCNYQSDEKFDCWSITSLITYHYNYPDQVISQYGDPLIDEMISLLKFENYGYTISDQSGNDNDAYIYSLPNHEAEFVETGY